MATKDARDRLVSSPSVLTAVVVGGVLTLVGILVPIVGGQNDPFIVFGRNYLHDAIHVATGLGGLGAGYYADGTFARTYALGLGRSTCSSRWQGSSSCPSCAACSR